MATKLFTSYLSRAFDDPESLVSDAREELDGVEFDTMIGIGLSGALVIPLLARSLDKHFAIVRKDDGSHSESRIEGTIGDRWIFVDDFVSGGKTRAGVIREVEKRASGTDKWRYGAARFATEHVGSYLYAYLHHDHQRTGHFEPSEEYLSASYRRRWQLDLEPAPDPIEAPYFVGVV